MNLFERINNRFSRSNSPSVLPQNVPNRSSTDNGKASLMQQPLVSSLKNATPVVDYDCAEVWTNNLTAEPPQVLSSRGFDQGLAIPDEAYKPRLLQNKTTKTPISSLYNVSSNEDEEEEEDDGDDVEDRAGTSDDDKPQRYEGETAAQFNRRSLRIRRSQEKAKASLPPDFADRIEVAPRMCESFYRESKGGALGRDEPGLLDDPTTFRGSESDDGDAIAQPDVAESDKRRPNDITGPSWSVSSDRQSHERQSDHPSYNRAPTGIYWSTEGPQSLEQLMPFFRTKPAGTSYLIKAIAQRPNCRCALCGHESLLLFPVLETSVALAHWGTWTSMVKTHNRLTLHSRASTYQTIVTEVQANLVLFRQCRGWYEILNESFQPIPHLTTVEQMRRIMPSTFLIRQDLRCLLAPPSLTVPVVKETRPSSDEALLPPNAVSLASSAEILASSTVDILPAGTLMRYITYLPRCPVKRGRKTKELGLILATYRNPEPVPRCIDPDSTAALCRAYYIGLEDSTPAILPPKFSISPVAGPENISGVHSIASILRKFRLPLTVKPVVKPDCLVDDTQSSIQNASAPGLTCGLSAVPGLSFGEQTYLRLESLRRSDLLIIAPTSTPDRLYLITPSMLPDHVFQLGGTEDPAYLKLLENHRLQSANFLAMAHPRDSLSYLVRHMRDVTREPRQSYTNRRTKSTTSQPILTPNETHRIYDELDDIYFYIRHGYYPSKTRQPESSTKADLPPSGPKPSLDTPGQQNSNEMKKTPPINPRPSVVPKAEALLAASLSTPVRGVNDRKNLANGRAYVSGYRLQPKEQGI